MQSIGLRLALWRWLCVLVGRLPVIQHYLAPVRRSRACSMTDLVAFESQRAWDMLLLVLCWNTLYRRCSICQLVKGGDCLGALRIDVEHVCTWLQPAVCTPPLAMCTPGHGTVMSVVLLQFAMKTVTGDSISADGLESCYAVH